MIDHDINEEELGDQDGELLPDREAMSVITPLPEIELPLDSPKEAGEPGLPPRRD